jgi:hypothetical protein
VSKAAINMGMQVSLSYIDLHYFRYMPKSDMAESQLDLFLVFWGPTILISMVVELIYIQHQQLMSVLQSFLPVLIICFIDDCLSNWGEMES